MLQQVVLQEVLKHSWIVLVSPDEQLCKFTESLDKESFVESIYYLVLWVQEHIVDAMELLKRVCGSLVIWLPAKDPSPEPLLSHSFFT